MMQHQLLTLLKDFVPCHLNKSNTSADVFSYKVIVFKSFVKVAFIYSGYLLVNPNNIDVSSSSSCSLWIHGAYGTGKSKCAYALKKILEVREEELNTYWGKYEQLRTNKQLLGKIIGHKE